MRWWILSYLGIDDTWTIVHSSCKRHPIKDDEHCRREIVSGWQCSVRPPKPDAPEENGQAHRENSQIGGAYVDFAHGPADQDGRAAEGNRDTHPPSSGHGLGNFLFYPISR